MAKPKEPKEPKKPKKETPEEKTPKVKSKYYDVLDAKKELLNIFTDKKAAEELAGKEKGRKVVPSPADRKREDVEEAINKKKVSRLEELGGPNPKEPKSEMPTA